jgi:hypothetical protein
MVMTDRPGPEVPKDYKKVIIHLIDNEGWAYRKPSGNGYPKLRPADPAQPPITVPKTPGSQRTYINWLAEIRRKGGHWPPAGKKGK